MQYVVQQYAISERACDRQRWYTAKASIHQGLGGSRNVSIFRQPTTMDQPQYFSLWTFHLHSISLTQTSVVSPSRDCSSLQSQHTHAQHGHIFWGTQMCMWTMPSLTWQWNYLLYSDSGREAYLVYGIVDLAVDITLGVHSQWGVRVILVVL